MNRPALTLAALVAIGVLTACPKEKEYENGEHQKKMALKLPVGTPKRPEGMSALHLTHAGEISKQLVVDYFKTHNLPMNYTTTNDFQVENVDVITAKQVTERLQGVTTGLADDEQLAFATLVGKFTFTGPPKSRPATFTRAYAVFDLKNGNLMMVGTLNERADNATTSTAKQ